MLSNLVSGITKVGEGFDVAEQDVPIDIHYHKLLEWLVDRRKIQPTWKQEVNKIREKIQTALSDLPEGDLFASMTKDHDPSEVHYFICKCIFEALEKTDEAKERTLFGGYSSARLRQWQDIIKSYEHNCAYLGEASEMLISSVKYEIPSITKKIEKCQSQVQELTRKEEDFNKSSDEFKHKFQQECADLGIQGVNIQAELKAQLSQLPGCLREVVKVLKSSDAVERAVTYYREFINFNANFTREAESNVITIDVCPTLMEVYRSDLPDLPDDTTSENVENAASVDGMPISDAQQPVIDWDISIEPTETQPATEGGGQINWDISLEPATETFEINWDLGTAEIDSASPAADTGDKAPSIDWDISIEDGGEAEIVGTQSPNLSTEPQKVMFLEITENRNKFLNDLLELKAFLRQRLVELESDNDFAQSLSLLQSQSAPVIIQQQSATTVKSYISSIEAVIAALNSQKTRQLIEIKNSNRFLSRMAASINQNMTTANKFERNAVEARRKREDLQETISSAYPRMQFLTSFSKELKKHIEKSLSQHYHNRRVTLIGGDMAILAK